MRRVQSRVPGSMRNMKSLSSVSILVGWGSEKPVRTHASAFTLDRYLLGRSEIVSTIALILHGPLGTLFLQLWCSSRDSKTKAEMGICNGTEEQQSTPALHTGVPEKYVQYSLFFMKSCGLTV